MPVENRNDQFKQKLDTLTEVPEAYHFSPSAVWSKLETRLQSNSRRRSRSGFLYAAASVLFIMVSLLVYQNFFMQETTPLPLEANKNSEFKKSNPLPGLKSKGLSPVSKFIEKKQESKSKTSQQIIHITTPVPNIVTPQLTTHPVENSIQNESIVFKEKEKPEEISIAIVPVVPKLRFKIAHINEVNRNSLPDNIAKLGEKINYGLSLRKEDSYNSEEEVLQTPAYSLRKPKSFFSLINSQ